MLARSASCWRPTLPREGLDFQNFCHRLIHYEIPWNPNRMEQRNGRVDRHGQKADKVLVYHFVGQGYRDRAGRQFSGQVSDMEADLEFLMRAVRKVEAIREDLGKVGPVIAEQVEEAMLGRRTTLSTEKAEEESKSISRMLRFERDLQKQVQALMQQYRETRRELRLSPENIQKVVEVGLSGWRASRRSSRRRPTTASPCFPSATAEGKLGGLHRGGWSTRTRRGDPPRHVRRVGLPGAGRRGAGAPQPPPATDVPSCGCCGLKSGRIVGEPSSTGSRPEWCRTACWAPRR